MTLTTRISNIERKCPKADPMGDFLETLTTEELKALISLIKKIDHLEATGEDQGVTEEEMALIPRLEKLQPHFAR